MTKNKINAFQFFSILFLTRLLTTVTYIPAYAQGILLSDMIIQALLRSVVGFVVLIPLLLLFKKNPNMNIVEIAGKHFKPLGKIVGALYLLVLFYYTVATVSRLDVFTGTIVFPDIRVNYFIILVIAVCVYGAYLGIEALGRSAVISLVLVGVTISFLATVLCKKIDFLNYTPVFYNGVLPVLKSAFNGAGRTIEYVMIAIAFPRVSGKKTKGLFAWLIIQGIVTAFLFFVEVGVMGNFANTQLFPIHSLAALAEFSIFKRLDALVTGIWLLCAFLKISFLIYLQTDILKQILPHTDKKQQLLVIFVLLCVICFLLSLSIKGFMTVDNTTLKSSVVLTCAFLVPSIVLIFDKGARLWQKPLQ